MTAPDPQSTAGVEMNGYVWDGTRWVPKAELPKLPPEHPAAHPTLGPWAPSFPFRHELPDPHTFALLQGMSKDLHFIATVVKVVVIIIAVVVVLQVTAMIFAFSIVNSMMAAIANVLVR